MHASIILLAAALGYATATPAPQATQPTGPFFLGSACSTTAQCPNGSQCYAVNSMEIPHCGNFQATCTTDAQCATNSCVSGFCSGPVAPTLPLGTPCYESAQCAGGASCYSVNYMEIPTCGNFQAQCVSDSQCAFNTCVGGFCSGGLKTSSSFASVESFTTMATSTVKTMSSSNTTAPTFVPTGSTTMSMNTVPVGTGSATIVPSSNSTIPTGTRSPTPVFTGAGERLRAGVGSAVIGSAVVYALMIIF